MDLNSQLSYQSIQTVLTVYRPCNFNDIRKLSDMRDVLETHRAYLLIGHLIVIISTRDFDCSIHLMKYCRLRDESIIYTRRMEPYKNASCFNEGRQCSTSASVFEKRTISSLVEI
ncbi:uncharacterized protein [Mycetomoellerius zeteki]|uniref:uncharacterized protein n=1 Tax=Mycetomoellerius zeteki TaxID=64791 RepID=UPI00084EB603|nr:PREDICTED: uncharacterized protein LOC108728532 [Trachymyrmex zeteki]